MAVTILADLMLKFVGFRENQRGNVARFCKSPGHIQADCDKYKQYKREQENTAIHEAGFCAFLVEVPDETVERQDPFKYDQPELQ